MPKTTKLDPNLPPRADVEKFEMLSSLFHSVFTEVKTFSAKKPDEPLNKFKVGAINRVLDQIKSLLTSQPTVGFLDTLDEDSMPSNSDAVVILAQYEAALKHFRERYFRFDKNIHGQRWNVQEEPI